MMLSCSLLEKQERKMHPGSFFWEFLAGPHWPSTNITQLDLGVEAKISGCI